MVGKNTILTDNPFLTNRYEENKNPIRIIPTTTLDIPLDSNVLSDEGRTIIVTTEKGRDEYKIKQIRERGRSASSAVRIKSISWSLNVSWKTTSGLPA